MQYPLYTTLRAGREYSKLWPARAELNSLFIENKVILLTSVTGRYLPGLALLCAAVQYGYLGSAFLPQILAMMLFLVSLPLQGWYWLGVRAETKLPPSIASWYQQIRQQMQQHGVELAPVSQPGRYKDLAVLLKKAYQQLDKTFVRQWL
ncbi:terminus macrodomain insulation protein YfbV [Rheinheimera oceanensis]|uniref:terminus macrodomain insulation protein YfbV n=1 Tax=Rheinheimera oceanensis TaxID=2817449 RepID=UPI001BFCFD0C|nr:terminus macrodomain insulation protein YfbV [Rheinheimera oceanensis]